MELSRVRPEITPTAWGLGKRGAVAVEVGQDMQTFGEGVLRTKLLDTIEQHVVGVITEIPPPTMPGKDMVEECAASGLSALIQPETGGDSTIVGPPDTRNLARV